MLEIATATAPDYAGESSLILRIQNHDAEALAELHTRYHRVVYLLVFRIVGDTGVAEDLVQETFLRVWTAALLYDGRKGALASWLLTIARHRAIDYVRSKGRWKQRPWRPNETRDPRLCADLERSVLPSLELGLLSHAFRKLSLRERTVIDLAYGHGYSHSEIAHVLNRPLGTIKTWARTALATLRHATGMTKCGRFSIRQP